MSAHFVHKHLRDKSISHRGSPFQDTPATSHSQKLDRPHSSSLSIIATLLERILLLSAILALFALVIWLAWIALSYCIKFARGKLDDLDVGAQTKKNVKRAEEAPKKAFQFGIDAGRTAKGFFHGLVRGERGEDGRGRQAERRGLLRHDTYEERVVTGIPRGTYIQGYGYDREWYGDGTNDSSSQRSTSVSAGSSPKHKEDCDRQCGLTATRRSVH